MPRLIPSPLVAACALALALSLPFAATATAKVSAELRVVGKGGKVLSEQTLSTGTTKIKTSKKANCFGAGTAGSGKTVTVKGATALGLLGQASTSTAALRPLLVTDAFDFGLGICGVGASKVSGKASWYLKVNHKGAQVSGDAVKLHAGDEVLWDLAPSYPYPNELGLEVPEQVESDSAVDVRVISYDEKGRVKPVSGAIVFGNGLRNGRTGADGHLLIYLSALISSYTMLGAIHGDDIPSPLAPVYVCVSGGCQPPPVK